MFPPPVPATALIHAVNVSCAPVTSRAVVSGILTKLLPANCNAPPNRPTTRVAPVIAPGLRPFRSLATVPLASSKGHPPARPGRATLLLLSESCCPGFATSGQLSVVSGKPSQSLSPGHWAAAPPPDCPSIICLRLPTGSYWYCTSRPSG